MTLIGIVAIAENFAIGKDGGLPWHHSADLKHFKRTTDGHAVVMGRTTWESIGKRLPGRLNIVLTRDGSVDAEPGVVVCRSKDEVLELAAFLRCDLFVIGGAKTYDTFADAVEQWIVTEVPETVADADAFFPEETLEGFAPIGTEDLGDGLTVSYFVRKAE